MTLSIGVLAMVLPFVGGEATPNIPVDSLSHLEPDDVCSSEMKYFGSPLRVGRASMRGRSPRPIGPWTALA